MRPRLTAVSLVALLATASLSGCTSSPSAEESSAAACSALQNLGSVVEQSVVDLRSAETVGDIRQIREAVEAAYTDAREALAQVATARATELAEAWSTLLDGVENVSDDTALVEARDSLVEEARAFDQTRQDIDAGLGCG